MTSTDAKAAAERLKFAIISRAFVTSDTAKISRKNGTVRDDGWLFDLRRLSLEGASMSDIATLFWEAHDDVGPVQVGGLESGAIPVVAAIVARGFDSGRADMSGFFVRKSRKRDGLMQMIEGMLVPDRPIILVDDLLNTGESILRQVEILEELGYTVSGVWTILRFRDTGAYAGLTSKGIAVRSAFVLDDFAKELGVSPPKREHAHLPSSSYEVLWKFASDNPSYQHVVPKSDPAIDTERVYIGSDTGILWALNQADGSVAWSFRSGSSASGKGIFSSPLMIGDTVCFGSYDGNVYALDVKTGKKKWVYLEADWVGSSPTANEDGTVIFIGLEFGLWRKRGGIVALDAATGAKCWSYTDMPCYTHATPLYLAAHNEVAIGSNDGAVYLFDAQTGHLKWKHQTGMPTEAELDSGFSSFDIKGSLAYDPSSDILVAVNTRGTVLFIDRKSGSLRAGFGAEAGFFSTPLVHDGKVFVSCLDKNLYCLDPKTATVLWKWDAAARIFASPVLIEGSLYIGANSGRLTELDPATGSVRSVFRATERMTNRPAYNPATKNFFVSTFANELYCIAKSGPQTRTG